MSENIMYKNIADKMKETNEEIEELNNSITWWNNRYNALQRDYEELKQENERLIKELENISLDEANIRADVLLEQEDYKSRCEKANEFINKNTELEHDGDDYGYMEWINIINMDTMTFIYNLSDILNGVNIE